MFGFRKLKEKVRKQALVIAELELDNEQLVDECKELRRHITALADMLAEKTTPKSPKVDFAG